MPTLGLLVSWPLFIAMVIDYKTLFERLTKRYGGATPEALEGILCPVLIPIRTLDKKVYKMEGQPHWRASFTIAIDGDCEDLIVPGRTGKFVLNSYGSGGGWKEIAKGRILNRNDAEERFISGLGAGFMRSKSQLHGSWVRR